MRARHFLFKTQMPRQESLILHQGELNSATGGMPASSGAWHSSASHEDELKATQGSNTQRCPFLALDHWRPWLEPQSPLSTPLEKVA